MAQKKKILVVDDDQGVCLLVKKDLEAVGGFEVTATQDSQQTIALCHRLKPDMLLVDNVMPVKKGSDLVKEIKRDESLKGMAIVMLSGKGEMVFNVRKNKFEWQPNNPAVQTRGEILQDKDPEALAKGYGVDDYISKPFTSAILLSVIKDVFYRRSEKKTTPEDDPPLGGV